MSERTTINYNFLKDIKLDFERNQPGQDLKLPEDEPQRSIFKNFMIAMNRKVIYGMWTKQQYREWKKELSKIDERVICEIPTLFLQLIENTAEKNAEIAVLIRSIKLYQKIDDVSQKDFDRIISNLKSSSIVEVVRELLAKSYQVSNKIIVEELKANGLDSLEILVEHLKEADENQFKEKLYQEYDKNFKYVRCINGVDQIIDVERRMLIPKAIASMSYALSLERKKQYDNHERLMNAHNSKSRKNPVKLLHPFNDSK